MTDLEKYVNDIAEELENIAAGHGDEAEDFFEYFEDALDVEYTVDSCGHYRGAEIAVTLGGPNVYVNTRRAVVIGFWGSKKAEAPISRNTSAEIDAVFEEYFSCLF